MSNKHPSSDGLRKLADWLDEHGGNVRDVTAGGWMKAETPEALAILRRDAGGEIAGTSDRFPHLRTEFAGVSARLYFDKEKVFTRRVVEREEFVPPEAAA